MGPAMRTLLIGAVMAPALALACLLSEGPNEQLRLTSLDEVAALPGAVADAVAPGQVQVSLTRLKLVDGGCDGSGISCPALDSLKLHVTASDDVTPVEKLRYVGRFAAQAGDVASAPAGLLFRADADDASSVSAWLGWGGHRSGVDFDKPHVCFSLEAVDEAGNVGPPSDVLCVDTLDRSASTTEVVEGHSCRTPDGGCSAAGAGPLVLFGLALLGLRRRRRD